MTVRNEDEPKTLKDIRRATRKQYGAEVKIRIVLEGLRDEDSIAELCRREGIAQGVYYKWSKDFMEAGKRRLAGDTSRAANTDEVRDLRRESWQTGFCSISYALIARFAQSQIQDYPLKMQSLAIFRVKSWIDAMNSHAVAEAMVCSKSLAKWQGDTTQLSLGSGSETFESELIHAITATTISPEQGLNHRPDARGNSGIATTELGSPAAFSSDAQGAEEGARQRHQSAGLEYSLDNPPEWPLARAPQIGGRRKKRLQQRPFGIGQITWQS